MKRPNSKHLTQVRLYLTRTDLIFYYSTVGYYKAMFFPIIDIYLKSYFYNKVSNECIITCWMSKLPSNVFSKCRKMCHCAFSLLGRTKLESLNYIAIHIQHGSLINTSLRVHRSQRSGPSPTEAALEAGIIKVIMLEASVVRGVTVLEARTDRSYYNKVRRVREVTQLPTRRVRVIVFLVRSASWVRKTGEHCTPSALLPSEK